MSNDLGNRRKIKKQLGGFTLLELLVVLAIVGVMAGTAIFFSAPSATEEGRKLGTKVHDMLLQARFKSMLQRRIYGLELLDEDKTLRLVVMSDGSAVDADADTIGGGGGEGEGEGGAEGEGDTETPADDLLARLPDTTSGGGGDTEDDEGRPQITYAEYMQNALLLGLDLFQGETDWEELDDPTSTITIPEDFSVDIAAKGISLKRDIGLDEVDDDYVIPEEELDGEVAHEIQPVLLFFPDGRLSGEGQLEFVDATGEVVYSFSWTRLGDFTTDEDN